MPKRERLRGIQCLEVPLAIEPTATVPHRRRSRLSRHLRCARGQRTSGSIPALRHRSSTALVTSPKKKLLRTIERPFANVGEVAGDGSGGGHLGREEMCAASATLAAFEVAVRGGGAAFAWLQDVGVHTEAHAAAGLAPLEAGGLEDEVEAFFFGLMLHLLRAGNDHRAHSGGDVMAADDL